MSEIAMPRLSDSMEEGTIIRWLAADGASVEQGQEIVEIETDKASMVHEADGSGVLHIVAAEGDTLPVGALIAHLLAPGEESPEQSSQRSTAQDEQGAKDDPPALSQQEKETVTAGAQTIASEQTRVKASPLARRLAADQDLELSSIEGSGPHGRIVRADVERTSRERPSGAVPGQSSGSSAKGGTETVELTRTQALIARRMAEAKATIPEFTLRRAVDMQAAVELRAQLRELADLKDGPIPSYNDMIVKSCALALREFPKANGTYRDGRFELHQRINVGIAVATEDALLVPSIPDTDERSIWEITHLARRLAASARDGTITPPELAGGTFSVSNLGMFGVDSFTAVINPPQAAILAVGSLSERAIVRDGQIVAAHTMTLTLTCDHRILYGAEAAEFLARVCERLERPLTLLS